MYNSKDIKDYKNIPVEENDEDYVPAPNEIVNDPNDDNIELEENYI